MRRGRPGLTWWLAVMAIMLGLAGYWSWRHFAENHQPHNHPQEQTQARGPDCDHDHDHGRKVQDHAEPAPSAGQVRLTPEAIQQAHITTAPAQFGPMDIRVPFNGELVFNEERLAKIRSRVSGRVVRITADYGQPVRPGSLLAVIESVELGQAQMAWQQAQAKFRSARETYERACLLYEGKAISRAEYQERQARLEVERAELDQARNRLRLLGVNDPSLSGRQSGAPSGQGANSHDSLRAAFSLRSPLAGRVVDRNITPGLMVKEDEELFTVADTTALWCFVHIPEKDLPLVQVGAPAFISVSSLPGEQFPGRVDYLADALDKATRTVKARVRVDNRRQSLKAGMYADIDIKVGRRPALSVPESAVLIASGEPFVFVATAPGVYQKHLIKPGLKGGGRVEVLAGLAENDQVVVQGGFTLKSELEKGGGQGSLGHRDCH